jgi:hypothetical protein
MKRKDILSTAGRVGANMQPRPELPFCKAAHVDSHLTKSDFTSPAGSTRYSRFSGNSCASSASALLRVRGTSTGQFMRPARPYLRCAYQHPKACRNVSPAHVTGMCDSSHCDKKALFHRDAPGDEVLRRSIVRAGRIGRSCIGITGRQRLRIVRVVMID